MLEYEKIDELTDGLIRYASTNFKLIKLEAADHSAALGARFVTILLIGILVVFFLSFISLAAGLYLSSLTGSSYSGFLMVAGFYFLLCCILLIGRKKLLVRPIRNKIIQKVFSEN